MNQRVYDVPIPTLLEQAYDSNPDKEAVYDGIYRLTYRKLKAEVDCMASALAQLGIEKGDRLLVCLPNWHEFVVLYFAIAKIGAVLIPCNPRYRSEEINYFLENSEAKFVFTPVEVDENPLLEQFQAAKKEISTLQRIITVRSTTKGYDSYHELLELGRENPAPTVKINPEEDLFTILYTSGTTGKPKGAMLTHKNLAYSATVTKKFLHCTPDDVFLVVVPVFHVFGMAPSILCCVATGAKMVLKDKFKAEEVLSLIGQEKITVHHGVPSMFILELNHPSFKNFDLSSLRTGIIAAAPCPVEIIKRIRKDMGCEIVVGFGSTETSAALTATDFNDDDVARSETVGQSLEDGEMKVVDDHGKEVKLGEVGELASRGPAVMKGYYRMPEKTKEDMDDEGWFYTGDLGTIDQDGYIRIMGRKKEMIIRGGYNIYPREIEEILYQHPNVLDTAIIGLPDTVLGEVSCAAIKLKPGKNESEAKMKAFLQDKVADYKIPDKILFVEELPLTASGKIQKTALQTRLKEKLWSTLR